METIGIFLTAIATIVLAWVGLKRLHKTEAPKIVIDLKDHASSETLRRELPRSTLSAKASSPLSKEHRDMPTDKISDAPFLSQQYVADLGTHLMLNESAGDEIVLKLKDSKP
ncbi:MAG: hypothetical protein ACSHXB_10165 [Sulfitobacter sp.]